MLIRYTNARGNPVGTSNRLCLHPDETVVKARALRGAGSSYKQIADALGVPISTAWRWCNTTRKPPVAVRVVRVKPNTHLSGTGSGASGDAASGTPSAAPTPVPTPADYVDDLI